MAAPKAIERSPGTGRPAWTFARARWAASSGFRAACASSSSNVLQLLRLHPGLGSLCGSKLTALQDGRTLPHRHLGFVDLLRELLHVLIEAGHLGGALLRLHGAHLLGDGAALARKLTKQAEAKLGHARCDRAKGTRRAGHIHLGGVQGLAEHGVTGSVGHAGTTSAANHRAGEGHPPCRRLLRHRPAPRPSSTVCAAFPGRAIATMMGIPCRETVSAAPWKRCRPLGSWGWSAASSMLRPAA
jgi:hypothetical protein